MREFNIDIDIEKSIWAKSILILSISIYWFVSLPKTTRPTTTPIPATQPYYWHQTYATAPTQYQNYQYQPAMLGQPVNQYQTGFGGSTYGSNHGPNHGSNHAFGQYTGQNTLNYGSGPSYNTNNPLNYGNNQWNNGNNYGNNGGGEIPFSPPGKVVPFSPPRFFWFWNVPILGGDFGILKKYFKVEKLLFSNIFLPKYRFLHLKIETLGLSSDEDSSLQYFSCKIFSE